MRCINRTAGMAAALAAGAVLSMAASDPQEIVRKSVHAIQEDWAEAPKYSYVERDTEGKRHAPLTIKTSKVLMIDESPYNLVTAINDQPLSPADAAAEQRKLQKEIEKRQHESERERSKRIAKYDKERERNHHMLQEMVDAFEFHLTGQEEVNGHACWVLNAAPKPHYQPTNHEGRVLQGMRGQLWIDKASNQWVKVHAEVVKPVNFFGFFAKVGPGTEFDLEQAPVAGGVWLPTLFSVRVNASVLGFNQDSAESETYRDYQPMPRASALLQSSQ
jgi:hypothetical protein